MRENIFVFNSDEIKSFKKVYKKFLAEHWINEIKWNNFAIFNPQVGYKYKEAQSKLLFVGKATN